MKQNFIRHIAMSLLFFVGSMVYTQAQTVSVTLGGSASGQPLAPANAGPDIAQSLPTFTMTAQAPTTGTGIWTLQSGTATITTPSSPTTTVTGVPIGTSATLRWTVTSGSCTTNDAVVLTQKGVYASFYVLLEGPFSSATGLMNDAVRANTANNTPNSIQLPLQQPYNTLTIGGIAHNGMEEITLSVLSTTGANAIVDWVLIELRDATTPSVIVVSRAALLQANGKIVDLDGISDVFFPVPQASYHVAIKHRNHLGIRTKTPEVLSDVPKTIDFTNINNTNVLTNGAIGNYWKTVTYSISGTSYSKKLLNTGDSNRSTTITGADQLLFTRQNGLLNLTYFTATADFNMSGVVTGADKLRFSPNNGIIQPNFGQ
jgi:hypothetical protein